MLTRVAAQDETETVASSAKQHLKKIQVFQRTGDAPELFVQVFDDASPTVGTDAPDIVVKVPAGKVGAQATHASYVIGSDEGGYPFDTALSFAVTTTHDNGTGPDAGDEPEVLVLHDPAP